MTQNAANKQHN